MRSCVLPCLCCHSVGAGGLGELLADLQEPQEAAEYRINIKVRHSCHTEACACPWLTCMFNSPARMGYVPVHTPVSYINAGRSTNSIATQSGCFKLLQVATQLPPVPREPGRPRAHQSQAKQETLVSHTTCVCLCKLFCLYCLLRSTPKPSSVTVIACRVATLRKQAPQYWTPSMTGFRAGQEQLTTGPWSRSTMRAGGSM